jgi:hypothetical protein
MEALDRARYEVAIYESQIAVLLSVHKETPAEWDWQVIAESDPPEQSTKQCRHREQATLELETYKPSLVDRALKRADTKRAKLAEAIAAAERADDREFEEAVARYEADLQQWEEVTALARGVMGGEKEAFIAAIKMARPFDDVQGMGASLTIAMPAPECIVVNLVSNDQEAVPSRSKTLLKTGRVSTKEMPKSRFYALYQDHVCSCLLRVGREMLALLPVEMVIAHAETKLLNTRTGHMENQCIVSLAMPRETMDTLNFNLLDPSDSLDNFVHRMKFLKTKGFRAVEPLEWAELSSE